MFGNSITKFLKLDHLVSNLTGYVETKLELLKLELKENLASGIGTAITYLILSFVFAMVLLFISLGVAIVLDDTLGRFVGFAIVAGFYLIIGLILFANREALNKKFTRLLSETFNKKK
jgi:uncharacterized membrane protein YqjE